VLFEAVYQVLFRLFQPFHVFQPVPNPVPRDLKQGGTGENQAP
jgi:hypothetical protein